MKRLLLALPFVCVMALPAFAATPSSATTHAHLHPTAHAKPHHRVTAPADEYFGRQKYSILGIRNALHDLNIRYDGTAARTPFLYSNTANIEDAMHDWDKKYHGDLWLAHYLFQLDQLYMRVPADLGHVKVESLSHWIIAAYPNTYYSRYLIHIRAIHKNIAHHATPRPTPTETAPAISVPSAPASDASAMPFASPSDSPTP